MHKALRKDSGTHLMNVNYRKLKGILYLKYGHSTLYNTEAAKEDSVGGHWFFLGGDV